MRWALLGLGISLVVGTIGYFRGSLARSGLIGAVLVGTLTFGLGGWNWGLLLIAFFVSSSLLSSYRSREKVVLTERFAKGARRDLGQTLANGGLGALLAIGSTATRGLDSLWHAAFVGAMAAVNADTWATEIGVLSPSRPRLLTTGREVAVGTSGAVSWLGTAATLAGGAFIGLLAGLLRLTAGARPEQALLLVLGGLLGGLAGSLADSLLGATVQAIHFCDRCGKETERAYHRCGTATRHLRGWRWLSNDMVNLLSSIVGATVASGLVAWVG